MKAGGTIVICVAALALSACRAEIRGTVVDRDAGPAAGATVTILGSSLPEPRRVVADSLGRYHFTSLKPGRYTVETSLRGLDGRNHELILTPGTVVDLKLVMWGRSKRSPDGAQGPPGAVSDEAAVRAFIDRYVDALETRDPKLLETYFTADADRLVTTGEWGGGRDKGAGGGPGSAQAKPGSEHIAIENMRFVAPDVVIVDGRYEVTEGQSAVPRRRRTTFVIVRGAPGHWRIAAIRNMAPTDPAR